MSRFVVQWVSSERQKRSIIPRSFWYLSIAGSTILLSYALHQSDPVFATGQALGFFIYFRNLQLLRQTDVRGINDGAANESDKN